ncbi:MAG: polymer-forming cytoskeletal protein [Mariprofundaceae bacterium]|nr:polymer-forming cytoskeletal protein [Mariprofundaceae bacterium]
MKRGNNTVNNSNVGTIIGQHVKFTGELDFEGTVLIEGRFEGNIRSHNGGTLIVSDTAQITGDVDVPNLFLNGTIRGNVRGSESLKMTAAAKLIGDVEYHVLSLSEGASINGHCTRIDEKHTATATLEHKSPGTKPKPA